MRLVSFIDFKIESSTDLYDYLDNWLKSVQKFSNEEDHNIKKNFISTKNHIEITNDFEQANFRQLVNYFKSPEVLPALIIIPDSRYFAKNLIELVEKIIQINSLNCKVQCINSSWNDPINDTSQLTSLPNPKTGVIYIWESILVHYVDPIQTNKLRMSTSFDIEVVK